MDEMEERLIFYIILFLIIIISLSIFIKNYNTRIEKEVSNTTNTSYTTKSTTNSTNNEVNTNEDAIYYNVNNKARFYYSSDSKYYLILTDNFRAYSNPDMGTNDKRFLMNIDNFYSTESFTGRYKIEDNIIKLIVEAGCLTDDKFDCVIPDNVKVNKNILTLEYKTNEIQFGTIKLTEQR